MLETIWSIKLKFTAMLKEIKWNLSFRKQDLQSIKEFFSMLFHLLLVYTILFISDVLRFLKFMKSMISKKIIFIPLIIMFLLFALYLSFINGSPKRELFQEKIFPKFYYDTAIEIRDPKDRFAGTMAQPQSLVTNPSLFIDKVPSLFWSLLQEKYDPSLNFDSNATLFYEALFEGGYYNGIDVSSPLTESKKLILRMITEQDLDIKPNLTLTQQLINAFIKKHPFEEHTNNIKRLKLAKTFFHQLKANNGLNFKAWLLTQRDFFLVNGKGYGLKDCVEIFFGKSMDELSSAEEAILLALYEKPYHMNLSLKKQKQAWESIKNDAITLVNNSEIIENHYKIVSDIKKMTFPKLPSFPDSLMEVVGKITSKNQEQFSSLPTRSDALLQSLKGALNEDLDKLFQEYSISPKSKLLTKLTLNFDLNENFYFNHYFKAQIESLNLSTFWVSVVNEEGNLVRLYQQNTEYLHPPEIGNISKIFSTLLFVDRGDKYYTQYCNKNSKDELSSEVGEEKCVPKAWMDTRRLFASNKMLPNYDAFIKYKEKDKRGNNIYYEPIYKKKIEALYQNLALTSLENNEPIVDLGTGKLEMTPLELQTSLHKITQLLYNPNRISQGLKLIKSFEYHDIKESIIEEEVKFYSFESPEQVSPTFQNFFTKEKRITLQTIFKTPIYKNYGSLQWLKNYINVKFVFAQESHKNGVHWLVGAFKKSGKYYSFTIYLEDKELSKSKIKHRFQKVLESTIKSIVKSRKMKFEYMKQVFRD
ncbi:MAG: Unknown protein [uncultured Sulfurovum sp.]|uniref:Glycosyl transferase family 51 domain-containing protein n=1 Tax=uncultured Sulfurovum sp. TaxID=269237 RepID=A0A6S6U5F9_9BACT|nr:MAG: Unknown protein [uncultured Sulfurovum sp.]